MLSRNGPPFEHSKTNLSAQASPDGRTGQIKLVVAGGISYLAVDRPLEDDTKLASSGSRLA